MQNERNSQGSTDEMRLIRIRPANVRTLRQGCPQRLAMKVRPSTYGTTTARRPRRDPLEDSALGPVNAVLDLVEFHQKPLDEAIARWRAKPRKPCHPALVTWVTQAATHVEQAKRRLAHDTARSNPQPPPLSPVARSWARQRPIPGSDGATMYEEIVQGRRYEAEGVRELLLLRIGSVKKRPLDVAELAFTAAVTAGGCPVLGSPWSGRKLVIGSYEPPARVRVVEIGCTDGSVNVLFDDTAEVAHHQYQQHLGGQAPTRFMSDTHRPGPDCADCPLVAECPAVPVRPGLLGVSAPGAPRRAWSLSSARAYGQCPAQAHLQELWLPRDRTIEDTDSVRRGRAVHDWIEERHRRSPAIACDATDVPTADTWWSGAGKDSAVEIRLGVQMVGDHSLVCPLRELADFPEGDAVLPEHYLVVYDPEAATVVIAKADLLYRSPSGWVVRETKTSHAVGAGDPLTRYPQLALALVLAAEGAVPGGPQDCRVELELLSRTGPVLMTFDPRDSELVAHARSVVTEYVADWRTDQEFKARAGKHCRSCSFASWCPSARSQARA